MLQFSSSQFSNLRWRYFVESLLLKSTPNVSSVVLIEAASRIVSTLTAEAALAVCARVRRVAGIVVHCAFVA